MSLYRFYIERNVFIKITFRIDCKKNGVNWIFFPPLRPLEEVVTKKIKQPWDPDSQLAISPMSTPASGFSSKRKKCIVDDPMDFVDVDMLSIWNLNDLTRAGKLLRKPPLPCHFDDEHEMRRVYSMIYDVYRCKFEQKFYSTSYYT